MKPWCSFVSVVVIGVIPYIVLIQRINRIKAEEFSFKGCHKVYIDAGTNIGIQIRKLFEPELYPKAKMLPVFHKHFGPVRDRNMSEICAIGFEPNPVHAEKLQALEAAYRRCGWRVKIFTGIAVGGLTWVGEKVSFYRRPESGRNFWDGTLKRKAAKQTVSTSSVEVVSLADFIDDNFLNASSVLVKLDVEGSELGVLNDMMAKATLGRVVNELLIEFHPKLINRKWRKRLNEKLKAEMKRNSSTFKYSSLDDESFALSNFPLPTC